MRKFIKKQLLELYATIADGIKYVSTIKNKKQAESVLIDCYSAFSHIKEILQNALKEERFSAYEECIDEILNDMEIFNECIQERKDYSEILGILQSNLNVFYDMSVNEQERLEVVFLPYKASMFDSLESVWQAANEDENCDAYVIPIPYYDRNSDFTIREEHYEGNLFPEYVPITHYSDYNFEARKPDMIFIHNPYDDGNYITTVHPFFYSKNLKKFTDKLVYIPYFVLDEVDPYNKQAVKSISHFCTTQAVVNADAVVVQSEDMKKIYVDVLYNATKDSGIKREYWENKILGLGSPKFDKVLNTRKEDLKIPDKWLKIIEKSDGSRKKIIFYNTSISALLQGNETMLDKIKSVLSTFKESKDEVALLWRPHPLMKATLSSMRPRLCDEYEKIVENYISEGWGIYDDTPDNDRAMVLSDAYYGDWSSLVTLYKKTGKPIMIQNVNED
jgi:hypothetical protein